jgi:hypothetical protein
MSPAAADLQATTFTAVIWLAYWLANRRQPLPSRFLATWACFYAALTIWSLITGHGPVTRIMDGAFAAWCAYWAWKRRKPRQRKPSRVAGIVRDLGHRLVVSAT